MGINRPVPIVLAAVVVAALALAGYAVLTGGATDGMPDEITIGNQTFIRTDLTFTAEELGALRQIGQYKGLKIYEKVDIPYNEKFIRNSDGQYRLYKIEGPLVEKPNIYLYPEEETALRVWLDLKGRVTTSIPHYQDGWRVMVTPDGQITGDDGQQYSYLFYEAAVDYEFTLREGWIVRRSGFAHQMTTILADIGLNQQEKDDFIEYWDARLEWRTEAYTVYWLSPEEVNQVIGLNLSEKPDALLRAFFCFAPTDTDTELPEPSLPAFERQGFTVVEWGGIVKE